MHTSAAVIFAREFCKVTQRIKPQSELETELRGLEPKWQGCICFGCGGIGKIQDGPGGSALTKRFRTDQEVQD